MERNDKIEYLSRSGRKELTELIASKTREELIEERFDKKAKGIKCKPGRLPVNPKVAEILNVSIGTVKNWLSGRNQSCNLYADRILNKALELDPEGTISILRLEGDRHNEVIQKIIEKIGDKGA